MKVFLQATVIALLVIGVGSMIRDIWHVPLDLCTKLATTISLGVLALAAALTVVVWR